MEIADSLVPANAIADSPRGGILGEIVRGGKGRLTGRNLGWG
jgi:hypothetical protein